MLALAILPMLGAGGMQLFRAEVPDISAEKLKPRIIDTAKALWYIYFGLTVANIALLMAGGMDWQPLCSGRRDCVRLPRTTTRTSTITIAVCAVESSTGKMPCPMRRSTSF